MAAVVGGQSIHAVAERIGLGYQTVRRWVAEDGPVHGDNARTREELGALVYDAVAETLKSITARARVTGREDWIGQQSASQLAELAETEWDRVIRMVAGFRPTDPDAVRELPEPEPHRNGAVDPAT